MIVKMLVGGALTAAVVLLKSIPVIGSAPWACALIDAVFLMLLLYAAQRKGLPMALCAAVLMPVANWLQGAIPGYWVPFLVVGYGSAARLWCMDARRRTRAVSCAIAAYVWHVIGVCVGYVVLKDMGVGEALRSVVRNSWYIFAWFGGAVAAYALIDRYYLGKRV